MEQDAWIIGPDDPILITGATGFIGMRLVENLLEQANGLVEWMSGTIKAETVYRWNFDSVAILDVALLWVRTLFQRTSALQGHGRQNSRLTDAGVHGKSPKRFLRQPVGSFIT